jgi:hypothetical protein
VQDIHLEGLSKEQVFLCELLWNSEDPDAMIAQMPRGMAREARVIKEMLVLVEIDRYVAQMPQSDINRNVSNLFG